MNTIKIYTDGSSLGNPGPGGYGAVILNGEERIELAQGYTQTTNNRMELRAVIAGLKAIEQSSKIEILSDSAYVLNTFKQKWIYGWLKNGWKTSDRKPVKNSDLWKELLPLVERHEVTWTKVKGHAGVAGNERADVLARTAAAGSDELIEDDGTTVVSHIMTTTETPEKSLDKGEMIELTGVSVLQAMKERAEEILAPELTGAFVEEGFADDGTYCLTCGFDDGSFDPANGGHMSVVFNAIVIMGGASGQ